MSVCSSSAARIWPSRRYDQRRAEPGDNRKRELEQGSMGSKRAFGVRGETAYQRGSLDLHLILHHGRGVAVGLVDLAGHCSVLLPSSGISRAMERGGTHRRETDEVLEAPDEIVARPLDARCGEDVSGFAWLHGRRWEGGRVHVRAGVVRREEESMVDCLEAGSSVSSYSGGGRRSSIVACVTSEANVGSGHCDHAALGTKVPVGEGNCLNEVEMLWGDKGGFNA